MMDFKNVYVCIVFVALFCSAFGQLPVIVENIIEEVKRIGQTGRLNCTVAFQGNNIVQWEQLTGGSPMLISRNIDIIAKNDKSGFSGLRKYEIVRRNTPNERQVYTLVVRELERRDSGDYRCFIKVISEDRLKYPKKIGKLTVQVAPTIEAGFTTNTVNLKLGDTFNLTCSGDGVPKPNITWIRVSGKPLPNGRLSHRGGILQLNNVTKEARGLYQCRASNNVPPPATYNSKILIGFRPIVTAVQDTVGQASDRQLYVILECRVSGYPSPTVYWIKYERHVENKTLKDDQKYDMNQMISHGIGMDETEIWLSLKIHYVMAGDYTDYYCLGRNQYGEKMATIQVFQTFECQGPNCPSLDAGIDGANAVHASVAMVSIISLLIYSLI